MQVPVRFDRLQGVDLALVPQLVELVGVALDARHGLVVDHLDVFGRGKTFQTAPDAHDLAKLRQAGFRNTQAAAGQHFQRPFGHQLVHGFEHRHRAGVQGGGQAAQGDLFPGRHRAAHQELARLLLDLVRDGHAFLLVEQAFQDAVRGAANVACAIRT
ncbi:hypothetical protein G6F31_018869 [Rhizopus arrhizus]|nr:hypothetical protein G6F31_018869 [Rhizopus arrhizus]